MQEWTSETASDDARFTHICVGCRTLMLQHSPLCPHCFRSGLVLSRHHRPIDMHVPQVPGTTAQELSRSIRRTIPLQCCSGLMLGPGAFALTHGGPGSGKSTQALLVSDELKPSIYLP